MKVLYTIILVLFTVGLYAQNKSDEQIIQTVENGEISFQVRPNKTLNKKSALLNQISAANADEYLSEESFEDGFFPPTSWYLWTPGSINWQQNSVEVFAGSNSAFSAGQPNSEAWLITPLVDLTSASDPVLSYYDFFDNGSAVEYNDEHTIRVSSNYTNNGDPTTATWSDINILDIYEYQTWRREQISLEDYIGQTIYIAFYYAGNNIGSGSFQYGTDWYVDNVQVGEKEIESFEGDYFPPNNWNSYTPDFNEWYQENGQAVGGHNSAIVYGEPESEAWLISKPYDLTGATDPVLNYYDFFQFNGSVGDEHSVLVSTNYTDDPYSANWTNIYSNANDFFEWNLRQISLSSYSNQTIYIAFRYTGIVFAPEEYGTDWLIDEVVVYKDGSGGCTGSEPIPDCATLLSPPNGSTKLQTDVSIFWDRPINNDFTQQLVYVGTDGGGVNTPTNRTNGDIVSQYSIGRTITNLTQNTTYYWQIVPANQCNEAQNCPIWSFTTGDGNINFGGGGTTQGGYVYANSTSGASGAPSQPTYNWIDISGTGTDLISSITDDQTIGPYNIGFPFQFFGNSYTQFYINSNGFVTFGTTTGQTNFPHPIPSFSIPDDIIAGYWKNLNPANPNVSNSHLYYGMNSGNLVITFEKIGEVIWDEIQYVQGDEDGWITFQIILNPNGNVKIQFKEKGVSFEDDGAVGIESSDGSQGVLYKRYTYGGPIFDGSSPLAIDFGNNFVNATANIKIFLEGPYNSLNMNASIGTSVPINQPYNSSPLSYAGVETTTTSIVTTQNIVDWVYIELRSGSSANTATNVVSRRAALIKNTGEIVDVDGTSNVNFGSVPPGNYYIAVFHRNHLPIISSQIVTYN